jgi:hypothetical protein
VARWDEAWLGRLELELADLPFQSAHQRAVIRRTLGTDPVAFALIYLSHHLKSDETQGKITFSEAHFEWARAAERWKPGWSNHAPMADRHAYVAPRGTGKSTWWFLILPLWAGAYGHKKFAAAFANATAQAELHLSAMKNELDTNATLRNDFPELCTPRRRPTGVTVADRAGMINQRSGFTFAARGIDSAVLGMKVGSNRPDLLIMDDIEPDEASYSTELAVKRLGTAVDAILPLNVYASVVMVGTVTMPGSVMHQLVKSAQGVLQDGESTWISEEKITAHHHRAILTNDDGTERSLWPAKWPLEWLQGRRHTREYQKNYDNDPLARESVYWRKDDFRYGLLEGMTRVGLWIDPAITAKKTSDFTGLAVVGWSPPPPGARRVRDGLGRLVPDPGRVVVLHAVGVRLAGSPLRDYALQLLNRFPEIKIIFVEVNQGGDLWLDVFHDMPGVKIRLHTVSESKEIRFAAALEHYQWSDGGRVLHADRIAVLEEQQVGFPNAAYDDVADAAVAGINHFLTPAPPPAGHTTRSYL